MGTWPGPSRGRVDLKGGVAGTGREWMRGVLLSGVPTESKGPSKFL